jgi:hypothetical protein
VASPGSLYNGEGMRILEINVANSEPAHIYDPDCSLLAAYIVILKHMKLIFEIARINHRKGLPYASFRGFFCDLFRHVKQSSRIPLNPCRRGS